MSSSPSEDRCETIHVLLVDDEESFRVNLASMLRDDGHPVVDYPSAEAALSAGLSDVSVLVTDYSMPGASGVALADRLHEVRPRTPVVVVSAYRTETIETQAQRRPWVTLRSKPLDYDDLHALIHRLLA